MDLFDLEREKLGKKLAPLPSRFRPTKLEDFVGQEHIIDKNKMLYKAIINDKISSIIFYGPPGTGKTTLAQIIANTTKSEFLTLNATTSGVKDIKETIEKAKNNLGMYGKKTILFIDEIHRFNKSQQDTLLPFVENGTVVLVGATTENPFFEVNKALISRSMIFELQPLTKENIMEVVKKALADKEKGLGIYNTEITDEALNFLGEISSGDARVALNTLELAVVTKAPDFHNNGLITIDLTTVEECVQKKYLYYEKDGDNHYDTISAFIKSIRGSDPDAALHYLAKMIYAGEDPKFIARRLIISASEDIGNAEPNALNVAVSASRGVEFCGMPEGRLILAQATTYLASCPKSNSAYVGYNNAFQDILNSGNQQVPKHLKDSSYLGSKVLQNGVGYKYPHDFKDNYVSQQYLPDDLVDKKYYVPTENGKEVEIKKYLEKIENIKNRRKNEKL